MKKILLVLLAMVSLITLTSCGSVKAKELKIDGSKADEDDLEDFEEAMEEYFEENELDDKWYSIEMYQSTSADELGEKEDYKLTVETTGSYFFSKFAYNQKIKISTKISESYEIDGEPTEIETEITYIYKEGKAYCKTVTMTESETGSSKEVTYGSSSSLLTELSLYLRFIEGNGIADLMYSLVALEDGKLYKDDNSFAGSYEIDEKNNEGLTQVVYEYDEKTYQLKCFEMYSTSETDETNSVEYVKIKSKLFGMVNAPSNPEKYN